MEWKYLEWKDASKVLPDVSKTVLVAFGWDDPAIMRRDENGWFFIVPGGGADTKPYTDGDPTPKYWAYIEVPAECYV